MPAVRVLHEWILIPTEAIEDGMPVPAVVDFLRQEGVDVSPSTEPTP